MFLNQEPTKQEIKFLKKTVTQNRNVSKTIINMFKFIDIYFGLDFGFLTFKSLKGIVFFKIFSIMKCLVTCYLLFYYMTFSLPLIGMVWLSVYFTQYFFSILILDFSRAQKTFSGLLNDLLAIDSELGVNSSVFKLDQKLIFCIILCFLHRSGLFCAVCLSLNTLGCQEPVITYFVYISPFMSNDITMIVFSFIFYSVSCRIKKLSEVIENGWSDIVTCEYMYKGMIDSTDETMKTFEPLFITALLGSAPSVMIAVVIAVAQIEGFGGIQLPEVIYTGSLISTIEALTIIFVPVLFAGKLVLDVERLKIILHNRLLRDRGGPHCESIKRFIRYVEVRPFKFSVCHLTPIDWTLPVIIVNIYITYLIVTLQFTNLF